MKQLKKLITSSAYAFVWDSKYIHLTSIKSRVSRNAIRTLKLIANSPQIITLIFERGWKAGLRTPLSSTVNLFCSETSNVTRSLKYFALVMQ